jgi:uncharacterized protein YbjT (DUF2867 family)
MKIIITGATGMVGEGVLLECLQNPAITTVLIVNRRHFELTHPKLKELLVPDFLNLDNYTNDLKGFDACFYCAGISSVGLNEETYTKITYDTTIHFAKTLAKLNPNMVFNFVSGRSTDENGKSMWARVKGKTERALTEIGFKAVYNFRPAFMKPVKGQVNIKWLFKPIIWVYPHLFPKGSLTLNQVGQAMVNVVFNGYHTNILEVKDIRELAAS